MERPSVVIREKCDEVVRRVCRGLGVAIPDYVREDVVVATVELKNETKGHVDFVFKLSGAHGFGCPTPWLRAAKVVFLDDAVDEKKSVAGAPSNAKQCVSEGGPYKWKRRWKFAEGKPRVITARVELTFAEGCDVREKTFYHRAYPDGDATRSRAYAFETMRVKHDAGEDVEGERREREEKKVLKRERCEVEAAAIVGRKMRKRFDDGVDYVGEVTSHDPETGYFHVEYEDGDSEDLDDDELRPLFLERQQHVERCQEAELEDDDERGRVGPS
jgi:hypothetical protein